MKKLRLKESVKENLFCCLFVALIVAGVLLLSARNQQLDKKMTDMSSIQISQKNKN